MCAENIRQARVPELEFLDKVLAAIAAQEKGGNGSGAGGLDEQVLCCSRAHSPRQRYKRTYYPSCRSHLFLPFGYVQLSATAPRSEMKLHLC